MINLPDFSAYCEAACIVFWGEPDRKNFKELRWGRRDGYGGRSYSIRKKRWYDADNKRGGSTLELIAFEQGWTDTNGKPDQAFHGKARSRCSSPRRASSIHTMASSAQWATASY
jgi:hypothetical protein